MMENEFIIFDFQFNDEQLEQEFYDFFTRNNLDALFTDEHRASGIKVSELDAKSVVNVEGTYQYDYYDSRPGREKWYTRTRKRNEGANAQPLKEFADVLSMANDNIMYESAQFRILFNSNNFKAFMSRIKKITNYVINGINPEHEFNTWNIVWYNKELA